MVQIYISYTEKDSEELSRFRAHFGPVERATGLTVWCNTDVKKGFSYKEAEQHIRASDIFICLVSVEYLNSPYIIDSELPAIKHAAANRRALVIPIVLEKSFWELQFRGFQCLPLSPRKLVLPIHQWRSLNNGFHEAAEQAAQIIQRFIDTIPPQGAAEPGITLVVTEDGFDLGDASPSAAERSDPLQQTLLELLRERLKSLQEPLERLRNSHPILYQEIVAYRSFAEKDLAEVNVAALASLGTVIAGILKNLTPLLSSNTESAALEPEVRASIEGLLDHHARLIMGFAEGRELAARLMSYRSQIEGREQQAQNETHRVLEPMLKEPNLLADKAHRLISAVAAGVSSTEIAAYETLTESIRVAVRALASIGRTVGNRVGGIPNAITYASFLAPLAGDQNFEVYKAAINYIITNGAQLTAFSANQEDIRRLFGWILEQFGKQPRPQIAVAATAPAKAEVRAFYMELNVTRLQDGTREVATRIPGEQRIPLEALLSHPNFWGWADAFEKKVSQKRGKTDERVYYERSVSWEIVDVTNPTSATVSDVRLYFYENSADFRFHSGEIASRGREGDLIRITRSADEHSDYRCELARQGTTEHSSWLKLCSPGKRTPRVFGFELIDLPNRK
jgi:hypothetical protein